MERRPKRRAVVYMGLVALGVLILITTDWSTALIYALIVLVAVLVEWLVGRWSWFESRRVQRADERRAASGELPHLDHRGSEDLR
jgi:hypothetical protein